jgi:hypothetical protein
MCSKGEAGNLVSPTFVEVVTLPSVRFGSSRLAGMVTLLPLPGYLYRYLPKDG